MTLQLPITVNIPQLLKPSCFLGFLLLWLLMGAGIVSSWATTTIQPQTPRQELYLEAGSTIYIQPNAVVSGVTFTKHQEYQWTKALVQNQKEGLLYVATGTIFTIDTILHQTLSRAEPLQLLAQSHQKKSNRTASKTPKDKKCAATVIILPLHPYHKTASSQELHKIAPPTVTAETIKNTTKNKIIINFDCANQSFAFKVQELEKQQKKVQYLIASAFIEYSFSLPPPGPLTPKGGITY